MRKLLPLVTIATVLAGSLPVAAWLGGGFWFIDLFNHFQVQFAWFLLLCLLLLLLGRRWKSAALAGVFLLVPLVRILPWFSAVPAVAGGTGSVRLCSFNVLASNGRYSDAIAWVRKSAPDAIFFTEVDEDWSEALKELEHDYPHWINAGPDFAFFSKLPIQSSSVDLVSESGYPLLRVRLVTPGGPVTYIAGHPLPPMTPRWARSMDVFMEEMARCVESESGRVVVAGDFNSSRWSHRSKPLVNAGLIEAAKGKSPGPTWKRTNLIFGIPIDRMLYRGEGFGCRSFEIGPDLGSDHRPVTGEFVW
ncbi:endonuclease/exonuclease/phosphatase family protein [Luteolibacter luteus]|uniref:Endonuclease/exonuclease/phosphatase domain-containing protein n=1 Tax=Luteolibacter luteus TaxID=2728835 RepID=A0A858RL75_9BACT|nr:endonuclease/exonuclease/phosphatase family protein [Luteolibacter luteus]QJE98096.1 hypothetical protein HHL09_20675 [Luteolibacter luteus]